MSGPSSEVMALLADPAFPRLKARVVESTGLAYFLQREADLAARVRKRMLATRAADCAQYLALLMQADDSEREALACELTIGETHFFRFQEQFNVLRERVFPALIQAKEKERSLRIWSAGCATGPEPYSLAILLEHEFGTQLNDWNVSILGTDINQEFLQRASEGVFAEWALRGLSDDLRRRCFTAAPGGWRIGDRYRRWTRFQQQNLVLDPVPHCPGMPAAFDVILCRNVMIYFAEETIRQVLSSIHDALSPEGWLLVGHAEGNPEWFSRFQAHPMAGTVVYQRTGAAAKPPIPPRPPQMRSAVPPTGDALSELLSWRPHPIDLPASTPPVVPDAEPTAAPMDEVRELANLGAWRDTEEKAVRLLELEPLNALAHFYRGLALAQLGEAAEAEAALRRAIFLESDLALAYYHLGLLLAGQGDRAGAKKAFRNTARALDTVPGETVLDGADLTAARLREAAEAQAKGLEHD